MAKGAKTPGKNSRAARRGEDDDWDDSRSVASSSNATCTEEIELEEGITRFLRDLSERKAGGSERVAALQGLTSFLLADVCDTECEEHYEDILNACSTALRKGTAAEGCLAAQILGLMLLSLPETNERLFREVQSPLQKAAISGTNHDLRSSSISSLAMCCFLVAEDTLTTEEVMSTLHSLWKKGNGSSRAAALLGWSLLYTTGHTVPDVETVEELLSELMELLKDKEVAVRNAGGEAAALLYYKCGIACAQDAADEAEDMVDHSINGLSNGEEDEEEEEEDHLGELVDRMNKLATNRGDMGGLRRNKRERASLRSKFRGLLGGLKDGSTQSIKIKLQFGDTLVVDNLEGRIQLDAFKSFLAGGFQVHLQKNPALHRVFNFQPAGVRPERMSTLEKRLFKSPSSAQAKGRTAARKKDRGRKDMSATSFGYEDPF